MQFGWIVAVLLCPGPSAGSGEQVEQHGLFSGLLVRYVEDGLVDYEGFASDPDFQTYLDYLSSVSPDTLPGRDDQLAFWINAYNAYTIKLIIDRMPLSSIRDIGLGLPILFGPWSISMATVGGVEYTLNEIEHDIIRGEFRDPRIHFALVCASLSCPKLRREAYKGRALQDQLEEDAIRFINDPGLNRFDPDSESITISKIFDWYEGDFEEDSGSVRLFLMRYLLSQPARKLLGDEGAEFDYFPYDWSLNSR